MKIVELFASIEGEGVLAGRSSFFIRLFGCNLRCKWCDTKFSYDPKTVCEDLSIDEIVNGAAAVNTEIITVTGGEPFTNSDLALLCDKLLTLDRTIKIETNGTLWLDISDKVYLAVSPKPPHFTITKEAADRANELKFVVDLDLAIEHLLNDDFLAIYDRNIPLTLQIESSDAECSLKKALKLQKELLTHNIKSRIAPQLHKLLSLP
ncbi:7-carboxy-7-deazaguanine synthase [Campylobacterota bacterium]|nr:7-carboxy-7-deazaguanine synthase [Campylobacterota bacterium]